MFLKNHCARIDQMCMQFPDIAQIQAGTNYGPQWLGRATSRETFLTK
jgi:hypothetical protein